MLADRRTLFGQSHHPYTRALLSATPIADPDRPKRRIKLEGELPSPINPPSGCPFHPRCPLAFEPCPIDQPDLAAKQISWVGRRSPGRGSGRLPRHSWAEESQLPVATGNPASQGGVPAQRSARKSMKRRTFAGM